MTVRDSPSVGLSSPTGVPRLQSPRQPVSSTEERAVAALLDGPGGSGRTFAFAFTSGTGVVIRRTEAVARDLGRDTRSLTPDEHPQRTPSADGPLTDPECRRQECVSASHREKRPSRKRA
ncbi:hypothetical protein AB0K12_10360 [Nonomuraea sp. NPDC049419]|uniref:hypothetical protein n=1 Tax=Nonomuraea sp. NPDC049419 TaxID=3155772 RepID=UPI00341CE9BD